MTGRLYRLSFIVLILIVNACGHPMAQSDSPADEAFIEALRQRISQEKIVPEFGRLEIPPLYVNKPTFAFPENQGRVLQLNIFGYPDPKGTSQLVAPLIALGAQVAEQHQVSLAGIEIVFHRRQEYNPMQVWAATFPWGEAQTFRTPLTDELVEAMKPAE